jgi:hypothetical protein
MKLFIKNLFVIVLMGASTCLYAQLLIGKSAPSNSSVLLEFGPENKGFILPSVNETSGAVPGTFVFDLNTNSVRVLEQKNNGVQNNWTDLTFSEVEGQPHSFLNVGDDVIIESTGVVLGAESTLKPGALVLESKDKVMVLPKVSNPELNIPGAVAGTMVYDEENDMLAIFDGANWSYWN